MALCLMGIGALSLPHEAMASLAAEQGAPQSVPQGITALRHGLRDYILCLPSNSRELSSCAVCIRELVKRDGLLVDEKRLQSKLSSLSKKELNLLKEFPEENEDFSAVHKKYRRILSSVFYEPYSDDRTKPAGEARKATKMECAHLREEAVNKDERIRSLLDHMSADHIMVEYLGEDRPALVWAASWGSSEEKLSTLRAIVRSGASVDMEDSHGTTALHNTVLTGNLKGVEVLLRAGADVNKLYTKARTPLHLSVDGRDASIDIIQALIRAKADVDKEDIRGRTPAFLAAFNARTDVMELLIHAHADLNTPNLKGQTVLDYAAEGRWYPERASMVKMLIEHGASSCRLGEICKMYDLQVPLRYRREPIELECTDRPPDGIDIEDLQRDPEGTAGSFS